MALLTLPTEATSSNYKLLPGGQFYKTRSKPVLGIVLHITAGLQDLGLVGTDESAEGTIAWALRSGVKVSWHAGVDTDGIELCIPDWYTAFHAAGVNGPTVGIEISKLDIDWSDMPDAWLERTLRNAARYLAAIVKKYDLPLVLQTSKATVDSAIAANRKFGFVYHSTTSAGTRSDPGRNFPIERLFKYIREELAGTTTTEEDMELTSATVEGVRDMMHTYKTFVNPDDPASRTDPEKRVTAAFLLEGGITKGNQAIAEANAAKLAANAAKTSADAAAKAVGALSTKVDQLIEDLDTPQGPVLTPEQAEAILRDEIRSWLGGFTITQKEATP